MTFNTGNPIGSTDARDLSDNAENFDKALGTLDATWTDRLGVTRDSFEGRLAKGSFYRVGDFATGYTLTNMRQTLEYNGHEYSWSGSFPKVVPASSTPAGTGGIGSGAWVDRSDVTLRSEINIIQKRFACVADMVADTSLTVGKVIETTGYFVGSNYGGNSYQIVAAGTGTADGGSYITLANGLQAKGLFKNQSAILPHQFGCAGNNTAGDGPKLQAALSYAKLVNKPVDLIGGVYDVGGESFVVNYYHTALISTGQVATLNFTTLPTSGFGVQILGEYHRSNLEAYYQRHLSNKNVLENIMIKGLESYPGHNAVGLKIGDGYLVTSVFKTSNVFISGFKWFSEFTDSSWGFTLDRLQTKHGGLITPTYQEDFGENITLVAPFLGDTFGEKIVFNKGEFLILGGSIDNTPIVTNNDATVRWIGGHMENPGGSNPTMRFVECNDESSFYAPGLEITMNDPSQMVPGTEITQHWFYCEDGNQNGITLTGCKYTQHPFYRPDKGAIPALSLVAGRGRVVCDNANVNALSNQVYIPVGMNMRNALGNWDFENGHTRSWVISGTAAFYTDNIVYKSGLNSLKIVSTATNNGMARNRIVCSAGDKLVGSYWMKGVLDAGGSQTVQLKFYDRKDQLISSVSTNTKTATFDWTLGRMGGLAPDGTAYAEVVLELNFTGVSGTITGWFDGFILNVL